MAVARSSPAGSGAPVRCVARIRTRIMRLEPAGDIDHRRQARPVQPTQVVDGQQEPAAKRGDRPERFEGAARDGRLVGRPARRVLHAKGDGERSGLWRRAGGPGPRRGPRPGGRRAPSTTTAIPPRSARWRGHARRSPQLVDGRRPDGGLAEARRPLEEEGRRSVLPEPPLDAGDLGTSPDDVEDRRASRTPASTADGPPASQRPRGCAMVSECTDGPRLAIERPVASDAPRNEAAPPASIRRRPMADGAAGGTLLVQHGNHPGSQEV